MVTWTTEQSDDRGSIFIKDNEVEIVENIIVNPGLSWALERFVDRASFETLRSLVASADRKDARQTLSSFRPLLSQSFTRLFPSWKTLSA
jgi:hypothetical protein